MYKIELLTDCPYSCLRVRANVAKQEHLAQLPTKVDSQQDPEQRLVLELLELLHRQGDQSDARDDHGKAARQRHRRVGRVAPAHPVRHPAHLDVPEPQFLQILNERS